MCLGESHGLQFTCAALLLHYSSSFGFLCGTEQAWATGTAAQELRQQVGVLRARLQHGVAVSAVALAPTQGPATCFVCESPLTRQPAHLYPSRTHATAATCRSSTTNTNSTSNSSVIQAQGGKGKGPTGKSPSGSLQGLERDALSSSLGTNGGPTSHSGVLMFWCGHGAHRVCLALERGEGVSRQARPSAGPSAGTVAGAVGGWGHQGRTSGVAGDAAADEHLEECCLRCRDTGACAPGRGIWVEGGGGRQRGGERWSQGGGGGSGVRGVRGLGGSAFKMAGDRGAQEPPLDPLSRVSPGRILLRFRVQVCDTSLTFHLFFSIMLWSTDTVLVLLLGDVAPALLSVGGAPGTGDAGTPFSDTDTLYSVRYTVPCCFFFPFTFLGCGLCSSVCWRSTRRRGCRSLWRPGRRPRQPKVEHSLMGLHPCLGRP